MIVTVGTCMVTLTVCVCVSYQCSWWRQLVGLRPLFHPTDHTEEEAGGGREEVGGGAGERRQGGKKGGRWG